MTNTNQSNQIQKFHSDEFGSLEVTMINGKPYFPASECAKLLGYSKPRNAVERHCRYALKQGVPHPQNPNKIIEINYIAEGDLYRLIIRSKLPAAIRFESWLCDVVLPSLRKYNAYIMPDTLEEMIQSPEFTAALLEELQKERAKTAELAPKANYYDKILSCKRTIPVSLIAKEYGLSASSFNILLHELGLQYKIAGTWLLYQQYAGMGYTQTKTYYYSENEATLHTCWTQRGRVFLYDFLLKHGIEPLANFLDDVEEFLYDDFEQIYLDYEEISETA